RSGVDQLDGITDRQGSAAHHVRIERDAAAEAAVDALQDLDVLLEGVGIEGRHDAALAEVADPDDRRTRAQRPAFPLPFRETQHAAHDDVRPQAAAIVAEGGDGAVGGDEKRQDVEALDAARPNEPRVLTSRRLDRLTDPRIGPGSLLDQRCSVRTEYGV